MNSSTATFTLPNGMSVHGLNRDETNFIYREIFENRIYLRHGLKFEEAACIFDVGANSGLFSLFASGLNPGARIHCFEPVPEVYEKLRLNAEMHGYNAVLHNCGLSSRSGEASISYSPYFSTMAGFQGGNGSLRDLADIIISLLSGLKRSLHPGALARVIKSGFRTARGMLVRRRADVKMRTVSEIIAEYGIERIDLFKMDVEGSELEVLKGISEVDWPRIQQFVMELHPGILGADLPERMQALLEARGFRTVVDRDFDARMVYSLYFGFDYDSLSGANLVPINLPTLYAFRD
jgi:FkbM family methyltransferase